MRLIILYFVSFLLLFCCDIAVGDSLPSPILPAQNVVANDKPNDSGQQIVVSWDNSNCSNIAKYEIIRIDNSGKQIIVGEVDALKTQFEDSSKKKLALKDGVTYQYQINAVGYEQQSVMSDVSNKVVSSASLFKTERLLHFIVLVFFTGLFFVFVWMGRKGKQLYIRPIDAIDAMEDAVGRAAEMGRPVLYAPGLGSVTDPVTVASLGLLAKVAEKSARLHTKIKVPNYGPLTWPVSQEVVRQAFVRAGRPEDYSPDDVPYFTSRSFTYAAATAGLMIREKTASNFLIGHFYSESLILAETGVSTGALQIGGTDSVVQLPFFITTCDKTMIGEELFAAAALVSNDPVSRSTVKASDWFKILILGVLFMGLILSILLDTKILEGMIDQGTIDLLFKIRKGSL